MTDLATRPMFLRLFSNRFSQGEAPLDLWAFAIISNTTAAAPSPLRGGLGWGFGPLDIAQ